MKVLIITYYWPPSGGSGVQRWLKFAKYLPEFGWEPIILTVDPAKASYPQADASLGKDIPPSVRVERTGTFEILSLYKKASSQNKLPDGGTFSGGDSPSLLQKISRFIRGNFFVPDPRRGWNRYAYKKARQLIKEEDIRYVVTTSPPHSTQLIGLKLKKEFPNITWLADFRDPWTDIHYYEKLYPTALALKIDRRYERRVLEEADKVIVTCDVTKNVFLAKSDRLNAEKFSVITNGFDTEDFADVKQNRLSKFTITYIGILYYPIELEGLLNAFARLEEKENCLLRFVGHSGIILPEIEKRNLQNYTEIVPQVAHHEAIQLMADSSLLILLAPDKDKTSAFLPGKLFEYLAVRRPILCLASAGNEIRNIIRQCHAGECFNHSEEDEILTYLQQQKRLWELNHTPTLTGDDCYLQYSRKELTKKLNEVMLK